MLQGVRRRLVYVFFYELIAIVISALAFAALTGSRAGTSGAVAVVSSVVAVVWNMVFNMLFERWESRQKVRGRSVRRRVAHAVGFEGGLTLVFVPMFAWWLNISLVQAFMLDAGLLAFFLIYTFVYSWCFDRIFGLPASAG